MRKFIVTLCPATPRYLHADTANQFKSEGVYATSDKAKARVFDTFEAATEVAQRIRGWGGAQRVEEIAVEDTRQTLATEDDLCEVRDAATLAYTESFNGTDREPELKASAAVVQAIQDLGLTGCVEVRPGASCPLTVYIADHLGNTAQLDWDPMQDGFDITEATCLAEPEQDAAAGA